MRFFLDINKLRGTRLFCACKTLVRIFFHTQATTRVRGFEAFAHRSLWILRKFCLDNPVVFGHKCLAFTFFFYYKRKGRRLHTTSRAHIAQTAKTCHREIARKHGTPDKVDILAAFTSIGQMLIEGHQVRKRIVDFCFGKSRIAGAKNGNCRRNRLHLAQGV